MVLYKYEVPGHYSIFYGSEREIVKTATHYLGQICSTIPERRDMQPIEKIVLECYEPHRPRLNHFNIEIADLAEVRVFASAFRFIEKQVRRASDMKRGELYKLRTGDLYTRYVPETLMNGLHDFSWNENREKAMQWLELEEKEYHRERGARK